MTLSIHTIKKSKATSQKRKRIGRGNASGTGTYSGKGLKGQKSRSGVSNLKRLGMKQVLLRTPKVRGFKSRNPKNQVLNLSDLNINFKDGEEISPAVLLKKGLVKNTMEPVKLLGQGQLKVKNLQVSGLQLSASAREQIEKLGGKIK
jgi:large subunit ribosomal protein L15